MFHKIINSMNKFILQSKEDKSEIEILAMNIDKEHKILIKIEDKITLLSIEEFKSMTIGSNKEEPTHLIIN